MSGSQLKVLLDQGVVAVAAIHAFGRAQVVIALQLDAGDIFHDIDELVDGDRFAGAEVDGLENVASSVINSMPFMQSSMYMKLRVCSPVPQISISCLPVTLASITLRQIAAGAFSRPPYQVPHGP